MEVLYEIVKNGKIIANMIKGIDSPTDTLEELVKMINNYNRNLIDSNLFNIYYKILGLRFLERADYQGHRSDVHFVPDIYLSTRTFIADTYPFVDISKEDECFIRDGLIGLTDENMKKNKEGVDRIITISLDNNNICFENFLTAYSFEDFESFGTGFVSDLNTCEHDFSNVKFNELEDFCSFLYVNTPGFLLKDSPKRVYMLYEE